MTETEIVKVGGQGRINIRPSGETCRQPQPLTTHTHTYAHTPYTPGMRGGEALMDGAADASQSLIARFSPRARATSSQAVGGGRGGGEGGADYSDLRVAGSGRLFEFGEGSGRPVVEKTAFFHAFGWVM